jgi:hypothetical protein
MQTLEWNTSIPAATRTLLDATFRQLMRMAEADPQAAESVARSVAEQMAARQVSTRTTGSSNPKHDENGGALHHRPRQCGSSTLLLLLHRRCLPSLPSIRVHLWQLAFLNARSLGVTSSTLTLVVQEPWRWSALASRRRQMSCDARESQCR